MESTDLRRRTMQAVKSKDTSAEMKVRRLLHSAGFRYKLHDKQLPGSPDIVFTPRRKVILIHGCFWHGHECQRGARVPKTNTDYWRAKIDRNRQRDLRVAEQLREAGWGVLIIWECEIKSLDLATLSSFLCQQPQ